VNVLVRQAIKHPGTHYAFLTDTYSHAKDIAWDRILKTCLAALVRTGQVKFHESDLRVTFANGSDLKLYGVDTKPEALRGQHLDGVVFDEYALIPPHVWEKIVFPTLQRRNGGAIFIGTPEGRNHFYSLYKRAEVTAGWFAATVRADQSGVFTAAQLADAQATQTPETYAQEYECSFETAIAGAYYARELRAARESGRIKRVAWDAVIPVDTWWDLGYTDATAIIFTQTVGREVHVIDYLEDRGKDLTVYVRAIRERPYLYGRHHLPHDATAKHEAAAGRSIELQLRELQLRPLTVLQRNEPLDGINQARTFFSRCWFDAVKCERLLDCLAFYHAKRDQKGNDDTRQPEHDWSSHAADAFRYLAVGHRRWSPDETTRPQVRSAFDAINHGRPASKPRVVSRWTP
jgi:hypothetical protein